LSIWRAVLILLRQQAIGVEKWNLGHAPRDTDQSDSLTFSHSLWGEPSGYAYYLCHCLSPFNFLNAMRVDLCLMLFIRPTFRVTLIN
jgi:hypothetical protein